MKNQTTLVLITARGGSKGLPGKNIRMLCGKPLLVWSIEAAKKSLPSDGATVVCSTDDPQIAAIASQAGADTPFLRPSELATDTASSVDVAIHALTWFRQHQGRSFDRILLLQPTSPLRTAGDISSAVQRFSDSECDSIIGVCEAKESPFRMYIESSQGTLAPLTGARDTYQQRQAMPKVFIENGAIYLTRVQTVIAQRSFIGKRCIPYIMPSERSVDIDSEDDFQSAALLLEARLNRCQSA